MKNEEMICFYLKPKPTQNSNFMSILKKSTEYGKLEAKTNEKKQFPVRESISSLVGLDT